ncbi:DUF1269 domain-containing protein [Noviherbaspirillum saxi]|uniref:DUF1269 domain-containing protein n=1 Tax=Noviherbaspirillum saxi TaxID=2320863 RepID=A0A3A3FSG4_9BURK|nr:DUF1269 domain-containing protein [Noviherbaspirillum saxi]RJF97428.1 DUF1269 domain-containing protein [Noviherbaspirillum saxi]
MRHRLFYLLPDIDSARRALDDMLLNRIEVRHIHFMSERSPVPPDLPEANVLQKTDVVHGAQAGMLVGALLGMMVATGVVAYFDPVAKATLAIAITLAAMVFGGWAASMVAAALPNSRLKSFYPELDKGKLLMIVDVPARQVRKIEKVMADRHPEMRFAGEAAGVPVFP